jgi:hypothetical protein
MHNMVHFPGHYAAAILSIVHCYDLTAAQGKYLMLPQ